MRFLLVALLVCLAGSAFAQEVAEPEPPPLMLRIVPQGGGRLDAAYARQDVVARRVIASVCTGCGVSLPAISPDKAALAAAPTPEP